jgi:succinylarginine dihydrolase
MTSFTIEKQGQEIQFDSSFTDVNDVRNYLRQQMSYNNFAMSLVEKKKVSEKQIAWMHYLATQSVIDSQTPVEKGEYIDLVEKMYDAGKNRKTKFQVRLPGITLSTVKSGANIGCVYVYENNQYVGKITQNGELKGNVSEDVKNLLEDANENLLQLAKIYGHESGSCSICGRTLNDPLSVQMGIGPVCAKLFN